VSQLLVEVAVAMMLVPVVTIGGTMVVKMVEMIEVVTVDSIVVVMGVVMVGTSVSVAATVTIVGSATFTDPLACTMPVPPPLDASPPDWSAQLLSSEQSGGSTVHPSSASGSHAYCPVRSTRLTGSPNTY
jgi:hypothetical protein